MWELNQEFSIVLTKVFVVRAAKNIHHPRKRTRVSRRRRSFEMLERRHLLAAVTWDGGGDGRFWHDPSNWDTDSLPDKADDVFIPASQAGAGIEYSQTTSPIKKLTSQVPLLVSGGTLAVTGDATTPQLSLDGGDLVGGRWTVQDAIYRQASLQSTQLSVTNHLLWQHSASTGRTIDGDSMLQIAPGATGTLLAGRSPLVDGTLSIFGTLTVEENSMAGSGSVVVESGGTFQKIGDRELVVSPNFTNDGTVDVQTETLRLTKGNAKGNFDDGNYNIAPDTFLVFSDSGSPRELSAEAVLSGSGELRFEGSVSQTRFAANIDELKTPITVDAGTVTWNTDKPIPRIDLLGGNLDSDGALVVSHLSWVDGNILADELIVETQLDLPDQSGSRRFILGGMTLGQNASSLWSGSRNLGIGVDAHFDVAGELELQGDADLVASSGALLNILPTGIVRKTSGEPSTIFPSVNLQGELQVDANQTLDFFRPIQQTAGEARIDGQTGVTLNEWTLAGGTLAGAGKIIADVNNTGGRIDPNDAAPGILTIEGDYTQSADGTLSIQLGGTDHEEFDRLVVSGTVELGGTIDVSLTEGFQPQLSDTFDIVSFQSVAGDFQTENGFEFSANRALTRESLDQSVRLAVRDTSGDADGTRQLLNQGLTQLRDLVPTWMSGFDLSEPSLAVLPDELASVFGLRAVAEDLVSDSLATIDDPVSTIQELTAAVKTMLGDRVSILCGEASAECTDGKLIEAELVLQAEALRANTEFDDATLDVMDAIAKSLDLDGSLDLTGNLEIRLHFGVDETGFYLGEATNVRLQVTGDGQVSGRSELGAAVSSNATGLAGTTGSGVAVTLSPAMLQPAVIDRLRTQDFDQAEDFVAKVSGDATVDLEFEIEPVGLSYSGQWQFSFAETISVVDQVDFPTGDELLIASLQYLGSGIDESFDDDLVELFNTIDIPLASGDPSDVVPGVTTAANDQLVWFEQILNQFRRLFEYEYVVDGAGFFVAPETGLVTSEGVALVETGNTRLTFDVDGSGVKVGVISDGAETANLVTLLQYPEITPGKLHFNETLGLGRGNEGTAMMEIIHDIAPQSDLYFAPVHSTEDYLAALDWFAESGVTVVVDDIELKNQPWFDLASDPVSQRIISLHENNDMVFIGASGNQAPNFFESSLNTQESVLTGISDQPRWYHSFGENLYPTVSEHVLPIIPRDVFRTPEITLQWTDDFNQPKHEFEIYLATADAEGQLNDYIAVDSSWSVTVDPSDPEAGPQARLTIPAQDSDVKRQVYYVAIRHMPTGDEATFDRDDLPEIRIAILSDGELDYRSVEGSLRGDTKLDEVISVGALRADGFPLQVEYETDRGVSSIYNADTETVDFGESLDLVAPSAVSTSASGGFGSVSGGKFRGSSAAAAHVAGIAALTRSYFTPSRAHGTLNANQLNQALREGALDIKALPYLVDDHYAFGFDIWNRGDALELDVLGNDIDVAGIEDGSVVPEETARQRLSGDLVISSANAKFGDVRIEGNKLFYEPFLDLTGNSEIQSFTPPYDIVTYGVNDPLLGETTATAMIWLDVFRSFASPDLLEIGAAGGTINVVNNDFLSKLDAVDQMEIRIAPLSDAGGSIALGDEFGDVQYVPPTGFVGHDTATYAIHDSGTGVLLTESNIRFAVESTPIHEPQESWLHVAGFDLLETSPDGQSMGFLFDPLVETFGSQEPFLEDAWVVTEYDSLQVAVEGNSIRIGAYGYLDAPSGVYQIKYKTDSLLESDVISTLNLVVDWMAGPIPVPQTVFTGDLTVPLTLQPALNLPADFEFSTDLPGERFASDFPIESRRIGSTGSQVFYQQPFGRRQDLVIADRSYTASQHPRELVGELTTLSLYPFGFQNGFDPQSGYGLANALRTMLVADELVTATPDAEANRSSFLASTLGESENPQSPTLIEVVESLPGLSVQHWIGDTLIESFLTDSLDGIDEILSLRYEADPGTSTPARAGFVFDADSVAGLASLDLNGRVDATLAPDLSIGLGFDTGGFYVTGDSVVGGRILGSATANATLGGLDAKAVGTTQFDAAIELSALDASEDGRIRLAELPDADWGALLDIQLSEIESDLSIELSSPLLDYVDADGNPSNNSTRGGDVFRILASTTAVIDDPNSGQPSIMWDAIRIANPDVDANGTDDFTSQVLAENFRRLALDVVRGNRTEISDALLSAFAKLLPLGNAEDPNAEIADALQFHRAFAETLLSATDVVYVIPFSDGATDDGVNNTIEDWLNFGVPGSNTDLIRVSIDLADLGLVPKEGVEFDVSTLFPEGVINDLRVGIENASLDGQLVIGADLSGELMYLSTQPDAVSDIVSEIKAQFDVYVGFSGSPLLGFDGLVFDGADARVTPKLTVDFGQQEDGKLGLREFLFPQGERASQVELIVEDFDVMTFSAEDIQLSTLLGSVHASDDDLSDDELAVNAVIDLGEKTIVGSIDRLTGTLLGIEAGLDADEVEFAFGDAFPSQSPVMTADEASIQYRLFGPEPINLRAYDLGIYRDGDVLARRLQADSEGDLIQSVGLGGVFPFKVSQIGIEIPADDQGDQPDITLVDFTYETDSGANLPVNIDVTGYADLSIYEGSAFQPSIQIGGSPLPTGPDNRFTFTYQYLEGRLRPYELGPIAMAFDSRIAPGMNLKGAINLGGYNEGVWDSSLSGSLSAVLDADENQADLSVTILPGSTLDIETGVLDVRAHVTLEAGLSGEIDGFEFDGGVLPFRMLVDVDQVDGAFEFGEFRVEFGSLEIDRLFFEISDLLTIEASQITLDPDASNGEAIASIGTLDVIIPSTSVLAGTSVTIVGSDLALYDDRLEISNLTLGLTGILSIGPLDVLAVTDLQVSLQEVQFAFGSFATLLDSETVTSSLTHSFFATTSRIDVSLTSGVLFPDPAPAGTVSQTGTASMTGLNATIETDTTGAPSIFGTIDTTQQKVLSSESVTFETLGVAFYLGGDPNRPVLTADESTLGLTLLDNQRLDFVAKELRVTQQGQWSISGAEINADSGIAQTLGLAGVIPVDIVSADVERSDGERMMIYSPGGAFLGDAFSARIQVGLDHDFFASMPFDPVLIVDGNRINPPGSQLGVGDTFEVSFHISNEDGGVPEIQIADIGELTLGIENFALGPFAIPTASVTLGGYVDGEFQKNFGADVSLSFSEGDFDLTGGVFVDPATSQLILPDTDDAADLPNVAQLSVDVSLTGGVAVGSLAAGSPNANSGFAIENVSIPLHLNFAVESSAAGFRLLAVDDQPFLTLGDNSVTAGRVAFELDEFIAMRGTNVALDFDAFQVDSTGRFQSTSGPFISFGGTAPTRVEPSGEEHLPTLTGGEGALTVRLGERGDPSNAFSGFTGTAGNFGIGYDPESLLLLSLVPLDGMFVSLTTPDDFNFGLPPEIPIRLTELGLRLPDDLGTMMPIGGVKNLSAAGSLAFDVFAGSTLNVSGGIDSVQGGWPIRALVEDMEIDLGAIAQWASLVTNPDRVNELDAEIRDTVRDLVAEGKTLEAIGLIGVDLFQSIDLPPVIKDIDAVDFGIEPFDLGPIVVGGGLGFGVLDIDSDNDGQDDAAAFFGRVEGQFVYDGIGLGVELIVTEYGPVLGRVLAGAPIPIGTLIGSLVGSAAPVVGTAAGAAVGTASGFVISGLQGGLVFDGNPLPLINDPVDILNVEEIKTPLDVSLDDIKSSVAAAIANQNFTWDNGFKLIGTGMLNNIYAPGIANLRGTFGVNVGMKPSDFGLDEIPEDYRPTVDAAALGINEDDAFGVQFYGLSTVNVLGQELAAAGVLFDFIDPVNPVVNLAAQLPGEGNLLSFLLPVDSEVGARFETQGLANGAVIAVGTMIERVAAGVSAEMSQLFEDLASELNQFRDRTLAKIVLGDDGPETNIDAELLVKRLRSTIEDGIRILQGETVDTTGQILQDAILTASEVFRNLAGLYSSNVSELARLKKAYFDGTADAKAAVTTVIGNINDSATAQASVLADLIRNTDLTRIANDGELPGQGLDDQESGIVLTAEWFFDRFDQWAFDAKSDAFNHPFVDVALVEFVAAEFLHLVREVDPSLVAQNLFNSLDENDVFRTLKSGIESQFENLAELIDPFGQPVTFVAAKTASAAKAALERQFELASAIGTLVTSAADAGLSEFFETIDPSLTISGAIQPVLLGIPLGEPADSIEVRIDKESFRFDATARVIEKLQLFAQQPLPLRDEIQIGVEVPFDNLFRDLAFGGIPEIDPARDWRFTFRGTVNVFSLFDLGDVAGIAFPAIDPMQPIDPGDDTNANGIPDTHPLDTHVQTILPGTDLRTLDFEPGLFGPQPTDAESTDVRRFNKIVVLDDPSVDDDFDLLQSVGGVLLDGRLTLPQFITDPFAWFSHLRGIGADLVEGCSASDDGMASGDLAANAFECFLMDPQSFMDAAADVADVIGSEQQIAQIQLFVPDFREELAGVLQLDHPSATIALIQNAIASNDPDALLEILDQASIDSLREKIFTQTYFRGQVGQAPTGDLPTTGRLLGIDLGGASIEYADPDPSDADPNDRSLLVSGTVAGVIGELELSGVGGSFPRFGGHFSVGSKAEDAVAPVAAFENLLRDNPIVGVDDPTLSALADFLFDAPETENEAEAFGASLQVYSPGFSSEPSAPLIYRTGGIQVDAEVNYDNLFGSIHGELQFGIAPDAGSGIGFTAAGSFEGYGTLTLGGLVNIPLGSESAPLVQGELTEDGLLVLDVGHNIDQSSSPFSLQEDSRLRLLINLSDQAVTWQNDTSTIEVDGGQVRLSVKGGLQFDDLTLEGSFMLDIQDGEVVVAGTAEIDTGVFGAVLDRVGGSASVVGVWQSDPVGGHYGGAFGGLIVSGGFSSESEFFGADATLALGINTTQSVRSVNFESLDNAAVQIPTQLQDLLTLDPSSVRLFASGQVGLPGLQVDGSFSLEMTGSHVSVVASANADLLGAAASLSGMLQFDSAGIREASLQGDIGQIGADFLHVRDSYAFLNLSGGDLQATLVGGVLALPIGDGIDLPSLSVNVSADEIPKRRIYLRPDEFILDDFLGLDGTRRQAFDVSLREGVLKIERPAGISSLPLVSFPASNLNLDSFLVSANLLNPLDTEFALDVSGTLGVGDHILAEGSYTVSLDDGVLEFLMSSATELELGFLTASLEGFIRTDGTYAFDGGVSLDVNALGFGVQGDVSATLNPEGLELLFSGEINTPIGDLISGTGEISAAGCLAVGGNRVPLVSRACGAEFSIGDVTRLEGDPNENNNLETFYFTVSMSQFLSTAGPALVRIPVFLESDTSVSSSRRARIGNNPTVVINNVLLPGDDVRPFVIPSVVFTRSTPLTRQVAVSVYRDTMSESDERFRVRLGIPTNEFGIPYGTVVDSIGIGTIKNDDPNPSVRGRAINASIAGGTVFFDANRNGAMDAAEPTATTGADGSFELILNPDLDRNQNGVYDPEEGNLVVSGGIDLGTGLTSQTTMTAPGGFEIVSPLTTLITSLVDHWGVELSDAEELLYERLGLSKEVSIRVSDLIAATIGGDVDAARAESTVIQLNSTATLLGKAISFDGEIDEADGSASVYHAIAGLIHSDDFAGDLGAESFVTLLVDQVSLANGVQFNASVANALVRVVVDMNRRLHSVAHIGERHELEIMKQIQSASLTNTVSELKQLVEGRLSADLFTQRNTGQQFDLRIESAMIGDLEPVQLSLSDSQPIPVNPQGTTTQTYTLSLSRISTMDVTARVNAFQRSAQQPFGPPVDVVIPAGQQEVVFEMNVDLASGIVEDSDLLVAISSASGAVVSDGIGIPVFDLPPQEISLMDDPELAGHEILWLQGTDGRDQIRIGLNEVLNHVEIWTNGVFRRSYDATFLSRIQVDTGAGNDFVHSYGNLPVELWVNTGDGNDWIATGAGNDVVDSGSGHDVVTSRGGDDLVIGGEGNDLIYSGVGKDTVIAGEGIDFVYAGDGDDIVNGNEGRDWINGGDGNDTLDGGTEADHLFGGAGEDDLDGGEGNDRAFGGIGNDFIRGGDGDDKLFGSAGDDTIEGGDGNDAMRLGAGDDTADGGSGRDFVDGGRGNDTIRGGPGNDHLRGGLGDDVINGDSGNDLLDGNAGDDQLIGGEGRDRLRGGSGSNDLVQDQPETEDVFSVDDLPSVLPSRDVNGDGRITSLDALMVINGLSRNQSANSELGEDELADLDVNQDNVVSPLDALVVINQLALENESGGPGQFIADSLSSSAHENAEADFGLVEQQLSFRSMTIISLLDDEDESSWGEQVDAAFNEFELLI